MTGVSALGHQARPLTQPVDKVWRKLVAHAPEALAVVEANGCSYTRAQVQQASRDWQASLEEGLASAFEKRKVALVAENTVTWLAVFLGLLELGSVPVLLDKGEPFDALKAAAIELGASWLCVSGSLEALPLRTRLRRDDLCLVKVTSGSTGKAQGFEFTHSQMRLDGRQVCEAMGIRPEDRNLAVIPFGHSYGLGNLVLPLLEQGTAVLCADSPLPSVLSEFCARHRPTVFAAVPALLRALVRSRVEPEAFASLRLVITAGARIDAEDACAFTEHFGLQVHNFYGSSETGGIAYDASGEATATGRSVGRLMPGVRFEPLRGGRFRVKSGAVYGDGMFSPADLGEVNEAGELCLVGRVGRLIKIAGKRLDLAGLEAEIIALPGVRGVFVAPHPQRAEKLAALVACDVSAAQFRSQLAGILAAWKIPERLRVVEELPLTPRGKTDRKRALLLLA